jgi:hypothetical protein
MKDLKLKLVACSVLTAETREHHVTFLDMSHPARLSVLSGRFHLPKALPFHLHTVALAARSRLNAARNTQRHELNQNGSQRHTTKWRHAHMEHDVPLFAAE